MSNADLENCSIRETQRWLNIAMEELGNDDRRIALSALLTGLHALRDRVGTDNAIHLGGTIACTFARRLLRRVAAGRSHERRTASRHFLNMSEANPTKAFAVRSRIGRSPHLRCAVNGV